MASHGSLFGFNLLVLLGVLLVCFSPPVHAFGAGSMFVDLDLMSTPLC